MRSPASEPNDPHGTGSTSGPNSPGGGFDAATAAALGATHAHFEEALQLLDALARQLMQGPPPGGPSEPCRNAAARVLAIFDNEAPAHRATERQLVLPVLRQLGDAAGGALAERLEAEHDLLERDWGRCRPALVDLAERGQWPAESATFEFERWSDFTRLATAHMLAAQGTAYPAVLGLLESP